MARKRFDVSLKHLFETYAKDVVAYFAADLGLPSGGPVAVIDSDISTVSAAADKVFRVGGPRPWLLHLELQASHHHRLADSLLLYNVLLQKRHRLPVRSTLLLLRPEADRRSLTGILRRHYPREHCYLEFRYAVVRLWQQPVETFLYGGLGLLPLAPLTDVPKARLPGLIGHMKERVAAEASPAEAKDLWVATYLLLGLQYPREVIRHLLKGVRGMEESVTYQEIVEKGLAEGRAKGLAEGLAKSLETTREILLKLGRKHLGPPAPATRATLEGIKDLEQLKELTERLLDVSSWEELLATIPPKHPTRRRKKS